MTGGVILFAVVWSLIKVDADWSALLDGPQAAWRILQLMIEDITWDDVDASRCARCGTRSPWRGWGRCSPPSSPPARPSSPPRTSCRAGSRSSCASCSTCCGRSPRSCSAVALIPAFGLTKTAGVMAIAIGSVGTLAKLCSDVDRGHRPRADRGGRRRRRQSAAAAALERRAPGAAGDLVVRALPVRDQHPRVGGPRRARRRRHRRPVVPRLLLQAVGRRRARARRDDRRHDAGRLDLRLGAPPHPRRAARRLGRPTARTTTPSSAARHDDRPRRHRAGSRPRRLSRRRGPSRRRRRAR